MQQLAIHAAKTHLSRLIEAAVEGEDVAIAKGSKPLVRPGVDDWSHPDPFDRLLVVTATRHGLSLVSADPVFDETPTRIW